MNGVDKCRPYKAGVIWATLKKGILGCMKKMRLSPPFKISSISRYILLDGGSGIIKECENQSKLSPLQVEPCLRLEKMSHQMKFYSF